MMTSQPLDWVSLRWRQWRLTCTHKHIAHRHIHPYTRQQERGTEEAAFGYIPCDVGNSSVSATYAPTYNKYTITIRCVYVEEGETSRP